MVKCGFCGYEIERGTGKIKIMKDGKVVPLCGTKCEKNLFKLGRIPREIGWTADYKAAKAMRLSTAAHQKENPGAEKKKEKVSKIIKEDKVAKAK